VLRSPPCWGRSLRHMGIPCGHRFSGPRVNCPNWMAFLWHTTVLTRAITRRSQCRTTDLTDILTEGSQQLVVSLLSSPYQSEVRFMLVDRPFVVRIGQVCRRYDSCEAASSSVDDVRICDERKLCEFDPSLHR